MSRRNRHHDRPVGKILVSHGPGVRIKGFVGQIIDRYAELAEDAARVGDRILAEQYAQHAEHYRRVEAEVT